MRGTRGTGGTNPEKPSEIGDFSVSGAVPHDFKSWGTGEQIREPDPAGEESPERGNLFPVPHGPEAAGNKPKVGNSEQNQAVFESGPLVPHVPRQYIDKHARDVVPDSRHPLIPDAILAKIEAIEAEARGKGWPAELLWNNALWDLPRGLAVVLDVGDEIGEVTPEYIEIWKLRCNRRRFMRRVA